MKTVLYLNVYSDYYHYDEGTETCLAARMKYKEEKDFPLLQPGVKVILGNLSYTIEEVSLSEDGRQVAFFKTNIGYNRYRKEKLPELSKYGWMLEVEHHPY